MTFDEHAARLLIASIKSDFSPDKSETYWIQVPSEPTLEWLSAIQDSRGALLVNLSELVAVLTLIIQCAPRPPESVGIARTGFRWVPRWVTPEWIAAVNAPCGHVDEIIATLISCAPTFSDDTKCSESS